jgi:hypothetical protein
VNASVGAGLPLTLVGLIFLLVSSIIGSAAGCKISGLPGIGEGSCCCVAQAPIVYSTSSEAPNVSVSVVNPVGVAGGVQLPMAVYPSQRAANVALAAGGFGGSVAVQMGGPGQQGDHAHVQVAQPQGMHVQQLPTGQYVMMANGAPMQMQAQHQSQAVAAPAPAAVAAPARGPAAVVQGWGEPMSPPHAGAVKFEST